MEFKPIDFDAFRMTIEDVIEILSDKRLDADQAFAKLGEYLGAPSAEECELLQTIKAPLPDGLGDYLAEC